MITLFEASCPRLGKLNHLSFRQLSYLRSIIKTLPLKDAPEPISYIIFALFVRLNQYGRFTFAVERRMPFNAR